MLNNKVLIKLSIHKKIINKVKYSNLFNKYSQKKSKKLIKLLKLSILN